jgi:hypothetical protein
LGAANRAPGSELSGGDPGLDIGKRHGEILSFGLQGQQPNTIGFGNTISDALY